ncbi:MAG: outer membrane lipid asymmetry maintenance protein MlaD [Bdellovibrionales bacterium]|nr:outer membrane lipid asymmetry maintenance protein MlaD [Bdellovibrionales bacterium]
MSEKSAEKTQREEFALPRRSFTVEFWVGVFTLIGVACFSYLAINIAGMKLSNAGYYMIQARFANVAGLQVGAPVEIAGVQIGEVNNVKLNETEALVSMQIREGIAVRDDDIAQIRTKGIIGDKYIRISPGGSTEHLQPGAELSDTESAVEFEEIIGKFIHSLDGNDEDVAQEKGNASTELE